jgi:hypothetical protein
MWQGVKTLASLKAKTPFASYSSCFTLQDRAGSIVADAGTSSLSVAQLGTAVLRSL